MALRVIRREPFSLQDEFYTVSEVASLLKVSKRTIYTWIEFGFLGAVRIAKDEKAKGTLRIPRSKLEEFIKTHLTI